MGNQASQMRTKMSMRRKHRISVTTGDRKGAGTDSNVYVVLYDVKGTKSNPIKLDKTFHNDLERGKTDVYHGPKVTKHFGQVEEIEVWRDSAGIFDPWYCDMIVVSDTRSEESQVFPMQRWVKPNMHYRIPAKHTCLPQDDKYPDIRAEQLREKRTEYEYEQKIPGLPTQVKKLPEDEQFSNEYKWDIVKLKYGMVVKSKLTQFQVRTPWKNLDDISQLYTYEVFTKPKVLKYYKDDLWFAAQRLAGCNPTQICLCTQIPDNFQVTDEMVNDLLEGLTLQQAVQQNRLFIIDHKIVGGLPVVKPEYELPCPVALFYLDNQKQLRPVAIQLRQEPADDNPVFLPTDAENVWMLAKMWFNLADAMVHQSLTHLGFTHLLMEGVVVCTHRNLALNHPLFRLLAPHFLFLLAINSRGLALLISQDGWVQKTMQIGVGGMAQLINRGLERYRMDVHGCLPEELKSRGVDDPNILPVYPYRDDAVPVYNAIKSYVSDILNHYYSTPEKLEKDGELQAWGRDLVTPRPQGVGLQGIANNGEFHSVDELVQVVTGIIFTCSVQHAINFIQYDEYSFPPNYPALLQAKLPRNKTDVPSDQDLVNMLADKATTLDTMLVTKLLSMQGTNKLGDWEFRYQHDQVALQAEQRFKEELAKISIEVKERNKTRSDMLKYDVVDPDIIPNSISI